MAAPDSTRDLRTSPLAQRVLVLLGVGLGGADGDRLAARHPRLGGVEAGADRGGGRAEVAPTAAELATRSASSTARR